MLIEKAIYETADKTFIKADFDGITRSFPKDLRNKEYRELAVQGVSIADYPGDPPPPSNDEIYDQVMKNQRVLKAFARCINDGSIVPGANVFNAALKVAVKAKM